MADHARLMITRAGWEPVSDPLEALAELLGEATAVKDQLGSQVDELRSLSIEDKLGREDVPALLAAYERALDRLGKLLVDAARLDLQGRIVRVREAQALAVIAALQRTLSDPALNLDPPKRDAAVAILRRELTGGGGVAA